MKKAIATAVTAALIVTIPGTNFVFAIETAGARVDSVRTIEAPAGIGSVNAAPISNLSAAGLEAAAAASLSEEAAMPAAMPSAIMTDGGSKAAPAGAKASAVEGLSSEVKQLGSEESGSADAGASLNAFYSGAKAGESDVVFHEIGHGLPTDGVMANGVIDHSYLDRSTAGHVKAVRTQKGGAMIGEAVVGGVVIGLAAYPRTRKYIIYQITNLYNRFRSPDSVAKEILARLEEGHAQYNQKVSAAKDQVTTLERGVKSLQDQLAPMKAQLDKKATELAAITDKESAAFKSGRSEAMNLQQQVSRLEGRVASAQKDVAVAQAAYETAMTEREQFFNIEAERMAAVQSRMTEKDAGVLNQQMAAMKDKYQLKGGEQMDVLTGKTNDEVAKGKAAMDSVNSSGAAQKANVEEAARQRGNEDALDALINSKKDNKGGSSVVGFDASTSKIFRYGTWAVLASAAFMAPGYALIGAAVLGIGAVLLAMSHPKAAQHIGGDLAVVGAGTLGIGILA